MQPIGSKEILLILLLLFLVYVVAAMFAAEGWVIYRLLTGRRVLPASPLVARRPVPWGFWTVLSTVVLYVVVSIGCIAAYARLTGRKPARSVAALHKATVAAPVRAPDGKQALVVHQDEARPTLPVEGVKHVKVGPAAKPKPAGRDAKDHPVSVSGGRSTTGELPLSMTEGMAIGVVTDAVLLIMLPLLLKVTSRSPLRDLGLGFERWWLQAAVGVIALLAIQPVVFGVQLATTRVWESNAHPLQKMVLDEFSAGVPELAILTAVFVAPLFEELMFRGIIQSWLVGLGSRRRRDLKPVLIESLAVPTIEASFAIAHWNPALGVWDADLDVEVQSVPAPEQVPAAATAPNERGPSGLAGITLTSLIFAALHGAQWPAPIALFVLSVVIGYVYHRTGSLITAFCMHATFNGLSTLVLLGSLLAPQTAQRPKSPVVKAPVSIVFNSATQQIACICREK